MVFVYESDLTEAKRTRNWTQWLWKKMELVWIQYNDKWYGSVGIIELGKGWRYEWHGDQFICKFNKLTSVFYASVLLLMMNFVTILSKSLWIHEAIVEWIRRLLWHVMTKLLINNRTDALITDTDQFVFYDNRLSNFPLSFDDASHELKIHVSVRILTI